VTEPNSDTLSIVGLVLGVVGIAIGLGPQEFGGFALAAGAAGLILGVIAERREKGRLASVAVVAGIFGVLLGIKHLIDMAAPTR
jgi:hypothetical protein